MKLYAGYTTAQYEYAIWARSLDHISTFLEMPFSTVKYWFRDQAGNKGLKKLCPDKTQMYRRDMNDPDAEWQPYRTVT